MTNELHEILKDMKHDINIISSMITSIEVADLIGENEQTSEIISESLCIIQNCIRRMEEKTNGKKF